MGSPFYNKNKSKLRKPVKTEMLDEVNLGNLKSKPREEKIYGSAPEPSVRNNVQKVLRTPKNYAKPIPKPDYPEPVEQVKVDYIPPRPLKNPTKQYIKPNYDLNKRKLNPIIEAHAPAQFEGAKPLAQSNQKRIYSTFKEQMEQLKNK